MEKSEIKMLASIYTGHSPLKYQLFKMGLVEDNVCCLCQEEKETAGHLVGECVAVARSRRLILERKFLTEEEVRKAAPKDLIRFFKGLNLEGN